MQLKNKLLKVRSLKNNPLNLLCIISTLLAGNCFAAIDKTQFAFGIKADLQGQSLYQFEVNSAIYENAQNSNLRDLRIFDPQDALVPLNIVRHVQEEIKSNRIVQKLVFFPVHEQITETPTENLNFYFKRDANGTIISIKPNSAGTSKAPDSPIKYYIVDLGTEHSKHKGKTLLQFEWNTETVEKSTTRVSSSSDLNIWQETTHKPLLYLKQQQQTLSLNQIEIDKPKRYLKIQFNQADFRIKQLSLITEHKPKTQIRQLSGQAQLISANTVERTESVERFESAERPQFLYQINGQYPWHSLLIHPQDSNAIYEIELHSGHEPNTTKTLRFKGSIYRLQVDQQTVFNPALKISHYPQKHTYWKLSINQSNQKAIPAPVLKYTYRPHNIMFLSSTPGLYTIAYGNARLSDPAPRIPTQITMKQNHVTTLSLSKSTTLGGVQKLSPPLPAKTYSKQILWAVLILVLLVMGIMVQRLIKHMKSAPTNQ